MAYTAINDPSVYFQTTLYTGTGSARSVTNDGNANLQPDWLWIKRRSASNASMIVNSSLGLSGNVAVASDLNLAAYATPVSALNSDGFSVNAGDASVNANGSTYVAWQWKINGGTTASNSNGTITSTVQANTTAGISIIAYTATGSNATIGHGLTKAPELLITKGLSDNHSWIVGSTADSSNLSKVLVLNNTDASVTATGNYQGVAPTNSVYSIGTSGGNNSTGNGGLYIAYAFHSVQGFSKFGKYRGNGNADGPFTYCGFKPAWVMIKRTDNTGEWHMWDNKREDYDGNPNDTVLRANNSNAESDSTTYSIDFLSNGFKIRNASDLDNASSSSQIYMAFAQNPFVASDVATTAR